MIIKTIDLFKKFLQYEKKILATNIKDWTYLQIIVACLSFITSIYSFVYIGFLLMISGFLWIITLLGSIAFFKWAQMGKNLTEDDIMFLKIFSAIFFIATISFFVLANFT